MLSRGSVVLTGSVTGSSFSVPVDSRMAPNARLVAYYVRSDGEVVADSISFDVSGVFDNEVTSIKENSDLFKIQFRNKLNHF